MRQVKRTVSGQELEGDGITNRGMDFSGAERKSVVSTDSDQEVGGQSIGRESESDGNAGKELHDCGRRLG
jgi:hypothetical protein